MEHILEIYIQNLPSNLRGFIFGFVHVGIMILGYYTGWSINRFLKIVSKGYIAGIFGAVFSHILADLIASYIDPHIRSMDFRNSNWRVTSTCIYSTFRGVDS